jgi:phosphate transport system substrate-binding protein
VDVQAVGSARGVSDTQQGLADIGLVARPLHPDESGLHSVLLARDAVAIVVPSSNPVKSLTEAQIVGIFTRATANWKLVGGADAPLTVVGQPETRSLTQVFLAHFKLKAGQVRYDTVAPDSREVIAILARKADAIGYVSVGAAADAPVRILPCNGVEPTPANITSGAYPLVRPFLLVTREKPQGLAQEFVDFARSAAVRDLLEKHHLIAPGN